MKKSLRKKIERELADRAASQGPMPPPNMTDEEEIAWLSNLIASKRREQGIRPDGTVDLSKLPKHVSTMLNRSGKLSPACSSTRRK